MIVHSIGRRLYYARKKMWKNGRILFPSPAEVQFIRIMGGSALVIDLIKHPKTDFPLTFIVSVGRHLRHEFISREYRVGPYYIDMAFHDNYGKRGIEIDGHEYHLDIVKEQERDTYLNNHGWKIMHIRAFELWRQPEKVKKRVLKFLAQ